MRVSEVAELIDSLKWDELVARNCGCAVIKQDRLTKIISTMDLLVGELTEYKTKEYVNDNRTVAIDFTIGE